MRDVRTILKAVWGRMTKRKHTDSENTDTSLKRCISLPRLVFIGLGKTVGVGIYVLIGVATQEAGPSVIFAFLIAFVVTLLNALCFAEFAAKNPKTGANYIYMYETAGEAVAFIIGWNSLFGYTTAFSLGARGWSGYMDSLFNHAIQNFTINHISDWSHGPKWLPDYPDFSAIFIILVVMVIASVGVNFSTIVNSLLAAVSGTLLILIIFCGIFYGTTKNWFEVEGGFFPFGLTGVIKASSKCFYAFQGFEVLGFSAEEAMNPKKNIPRSIVIMLSIVTCLYVGVAISFTLMVPYTEVNTQAPFPGAFQSNNIIWAKYIVAIGPLFALTNLCILEMYTLSRLTYSMSTDGLLFKFLSHVNKYTKVPLGPVLVLGPIVIVLVLVIDLSNLIEFMVIYTFIQYAVFAAYLIIQRFDSSENAVNTMKPKTCNGEENGHQKKQLVHSHKSKNRRSCIYFFKFNLTVKRLVIVVFVTCVLLALLLVKAGKDVMNKDTVAMVSLVTLVTIVVIATCLLWFKKQTRDPTVFTMPFMPFFSVLVILCNMIMMMSALDTGSLIASVIMATIGGTLYLAMVVYDVIKSRASSGSHDYTKLEQTGLLEDTECDEIMSLEDETRLTQ